MTREVDRECNDVGRKGRGDKMLSIHKPLFVSIVLVGLVYRPSWSLDTGEELIEWSGVRGGLVVVLNDESLIAEIQLDDRYLVQGLFNDEERKDGSVLCFE